jgi:hypothetical protein
VRVTPFAVMTALAAGGIGFGLAPARAELRLDTVNTIACAHEGGVCRMPHPTNVYFGVPGKTNGRPFPQGGSVPCNVQTFGDPAPGQAKSCWYAPRITEGGRDARSAPEPRYDDRPRYEDRSRYEDQPRSYDRRDAYRDDYRPRRRDEDDLPPRRRYRGDPEDE